MRLSSSSGMTAAETMPMYGVWMLLGTVAATQLAILSIVVQASSSADIDLLLTPTAWLSAIAFVSLLGGLLLVRFHRRRVSGAPNVPVAGVGAVRPRIRPVSA